MIVTTIASPRESRGYNLWVPGAHPIPPKNPYNDDCGGILRTLLLSLGAHRPCDIYQRPQALDLDYGVPAGLCKETAAGVFEREWSTSTVTVDCNSYTSEVHFK